MSPYMVVFYKNISKPDNLILFVSILHVIHTEMFNQEKKFVASFS